MSDTKKILLAPPGTQSTLLSIMSMTRDTHLYIFPSFPSILPSVCLHLSCQSRWTYGPEFWYGDGFSLWLANFWKIGVKGQRSGSEIHKNMPFRGRFWSQRLCVGLFRTRKGQVGYLWQHAN